ncbi:MAG: HAD-IC family P-type ATPase, partial [Desulfobulbaceae bacterium]|nr:HAD-IC family P-type ATPase [Desulfobulbaceae bacterium]
KAKVMRNGILETMDSMYLVPGDIIRIEAGDNVPADARIIESVRLKVEEASLTGESVPAEKGPMPLSEERQISDRKNMLFSSTAAVTGNCRAVITATGMETEIGKITRLIKEAEEEMTPLQKRLDVFGKKLGTVIIGICIFIFLLSFGKEYLTSGITAESFIAFAFIAISLAVAAVPTALPAVVTIALSIGVKRLLKKKALVRRLSSVETLGSCDVICTDKTGTLTENQMTVRHAWTLANEAEISGSGYDPQGALSEPVSPLLFATGLVCNNASFYEDSSGWKTTGDPTEAALLVSAAKAGAQTFHTRMDEIPFDSDRKLMSVLVEEDAKLRMYTKGAPGQLLAQCSHVRLGDDTVGLTPELREQILTQNDLYASSALRVLAFAYRDVAKKKDFREERLVFVGLQAMIDPPRPDVVESIRITKQAGIRVIMITGDYKETARA